MIYACLAMAPAHQAVKSEIRPDSFSLETIVTRSIPFHGTIGYSSAGRPIEAWYFPGKSTKRALIIGGVHGSELSSIELAGKIISELSAKPDNYYSVVVIPCLFPDNAHASDNRPSEIGGVMNIGRYSHSNAPDPNRQMPAPGTAFDSRNPLDFAGRMIESENQLLLSVIQKFKPERIANLHAIRDTKRAGIYADPRTDSRGIALEYHSDSALAVNMAMHIDVNGGWVPGNQLSDRPSSLYYCDPPVAAEGTAQRRNFQGSKLPNGRGHGVSLGTWATTAVDNPARPAMRVITIEFPGYRRSSDYPAPEDQQRVSLLVSLYAASVKNIFLGTN